jgi:hypothetical protein
VVAMVEYMEVIKVEAWVMVRWAKVEMRVVLDRKSCNLHHHQMKEG